MKVIMDIEADGLLNTATRMHCAVFKDIETQKMYEFIGWSDELKEFLDNCTMIAAHNGTDFDIPFLKKICNWVPKETVELVDTLVMSRLLNPDRRPVEGTRAPHSVEAWGKRLGRWKPEHEDWSVFSPEMLHRCKEDVEIQYMMYCVLCQEADITDPTKSIFKSSSYGGQDWHQAMILEHKSAAIIHEQSQNGCYFNKEAAERYVETLGEIVKDCEEKVLQYIPAKPVRKGVTIQEPFKKTGDLKKAVTDWGLDNVCGPFTRIEWASINLGSEKQLKEWLYSIGWEPDEWNHKKDKKGVFILDDDGNRIRTSPKVTESSLERLPIKDLGFLLIRRGKASHRRSQIAGWISHCREDNRVPGEANSLGTPTGRMKHRIIANVPKAAVYKNKKDHDDPRNGSLIWYPEEQSVFFGTEMRSLFVAPEGRVLVGRDASGLEARCFAHYLNNDEYTNTILTADIHDYNMIKAALDNRDQSKTFWYALLYGAGDEKVGSIKDPEASKAEKVASGKELIRTFFDSIDGMEKLIKGVKKAAGRGYLHGIDGRKLWIRKKNASLNTLLQGAGAQIMTYARVWLYEEVQKYPELSGAIKVLDYHDEETWECDPCQAELLKELMIQSVVEAGKFYKFNCPLDADAKIGHSWAEIH